MDPVEVPDVKDQRRVDFTDGDDLPDGARIHDSGGNESGMEVVDGALTHGPATGQDAISYLETELASDVQALGATVRFAGADSGSVALTAWQDSVVEAGEDGQPAPATGMRLVAVPGEWALVISAEGEDVIGQGTFAATTEPATFEVYRQDDVLIVVDPDGTVSTVQDPRIAELAGPWASWELAESGPDEAPAAFLALWAG